MYINKLSFKHKCSVAHIFLCDFSANRLEIRDNN